MILRIGRVALLLASEGIVAGCALALELAMARLMAPTTGMSTDSWVGIIGAFLLSWAVGSTISGWLAARLSARLMLRTCALALLLAAASAALSPWLALAADRMFVAADPLALWRMLAAVSMVCAPAGLLFGMIGPLLMTLLVQWTNASGLAIGMANMLGALGSCAGALLMPWMLLDTLGVQGTVQSIAVLTTLVAFILAGLSLPGEPAESAPAQAAPPVTGGTR